MELAAPRAAAVIFMRRPWQAGRLLLGRGKKQNYRLLARANVLLEIAEHGGMHRDGVPRPTID
jgi:hypothetical protein